MRCLSATRDEERGGRNMRVKGKCELGGGGGTGEGGSEKKKTDK
jgi:hypothetical protein